MLKTVWSNLTLSATLTVLLFPRIKHSSPKNTNLNYIEAGTVLSSSPDADTNQILRVLFQDHCSRHSGNPPRIKQRYRNLHKSGCHHQRVISAFGMYCRIYWDSNDHIRNITHVKHSNYIIRERKIVLCVYIHKSNNNTFSF